MKLAPVVFAAFILVAFALAAQAPSAASMPPVVVSTVPQSGDLAVDPAIKEIRVTFSKEMMTNEMWSWVQVNEGTFPKVVAKSHYLQDKRTCVLPVRLDPGKSYIIWVNFESHNSFRDLANRPAVPYLLAFQTRQ